MVVPHVSKSALKNQGMSLRGSLRETKQSQGIEVCLHSVTWFGLFVPTYLQALCCKNNLESAGRGAK